jgi:hypothetical protein
MRGNENLTFSGEKRLKITPLDGFFKENLRWEGMRNEGWLVGNRKWFFDFNGVVPELPNRKLVSSLARILIADWRANLEKKRGRVVCFERCVAWIVAATGMLTRPNQKCKEEWFDKSLKPQTTRMKHNKKNVKGKA